MTIRQNIFWQYLEWHFFDVPREVLNAWKNFLKFGLYYFSLPFLFKTIFSPWRRYLWAYPKGLDIGKYVEVFFSNLISRLLGGIMRVFLIFFCLLFEGGALLGGVIVLLGWLILPIILAAGFILGLKYVQF